MPESLFYKVAGLRPATLLKRRLWHRCFPVNFAKLLRTHFFTENLWWLLLKLYNCWLMHKRTSIGTETIPSLHSKGGTTWHIRGCSIITSRVGGGCVSVFFLMLCDGKQRGEWYFIKDCNVTVKKIHKPFSCTTVKRSGFH